MKLLRYNVDIFAMSLHRNTYLQKVGSMAPVLEEHLVKAVAYREAKPDTFNYWINNEIPGFLVGLCKLSCKVNVKYKDIDKALFRNFGDDRNDAESCLFCFQQRNKLAPDPYPDFKITLEMIDNLFYVVSTLKPIIIESMVSNSLVPQSVWANRLSKIFESL